MNATEPILLATRVSKSHDGITKQFTDLSLNLPAGSKVALLGPNGAGKSTLLSILAGHARPDDGSVTLRRSTTLAYVAQSLPKMPNTTAREAALTLAAQHSNNPAVAAALRYERALIAAAQPSTAHTRALTAAAAAMDGLPDAWQVHSYLMSVFQELSLPPDTDLHTMSGGQQRRVAIAAALVARPDVLLLDEVTNHLSVDAVQFVERVLANPAITVLTTSHDRFFIDRVCTTAIWELDTKLRVYPPGYHNYLQQKAEERSMEQKRVTDLTNAYKKELEWMRRQPKARSTKSKARTDDALRMEQQLKDSKNRLNSSSTVKQLQTSTSRMGTDVLRVDNVTLKRSDKLLLKDFSYTFQRGERIGVVGTNAVGKTTFLHLLLGNVSPQKGSVHVGETISFGHYDQQGLDLSAPLSEVSKMLMKGATLDQIRLLDYVTELVSLYSPSKATSSSFSASQSDAKGGLDEAERKLASEIERLSLSMAIPDTAARTRTLDAQNSNPLAHMHPTSLLHQFGFSRDKNFTFLSSLSGGEMRRLQLMGLLLKNPNFLLLDEVSNDLDLNTLTMLEELLADYKGVLLLCSHDRFMLDRLVDHLLVFEGEGVVRMVEGKFTDYLEAKKQMELEEKKMRRNEAKTDVKGKNGAGKNEKRRLNYKEKREYEGIEGQMEVLQKRYDELTHLVETQAISAGYSRLAEWTQELAQVEQDVDSKTNRWMELAEIAGE